MKNNYTNFEKEELKMFGCEIRKHRLRQMFSQEQLAYLANINPKYLSDIECGKRNVALLNIFCLAKALRISVKELFDYHNSKIDL